jgi:Carbohydrate binding domain
MTTPFQPTLPSEVPFTEAEISFLDDSPPGLYPENQNSNYGLLRKANTDQIQSLIDQLELIYNERFVRTSVTFIDVWEQEMGLPVNPEGKSLDQRRVIVLGRIAKGPFTRTRRAQTVEGYIVATFGGPIQIFPEGVELSAAGTPLYAEFADVKTLYSIRENNPAGKNLLTNGNFENDTTGWGTAGVGTNNFGRSTSASKFGTNSAYITSTAADPFSAYVGYQHALTGATANRTFTFSVWIYGGAGASAGKRMSIAIREFGGAAAYDQTLQYFTLTSGWQKVVVTRTILENDRTALQLFVWGAIDTGTGLANGDTIYFDGAQLEENFKPYGKNLLLNGDFEYDVAGWNPSNFTLTRVTSEAHHGAASMQVAATGTTNLWIYGTIQLPPGGTAGLKFTVSFWVKGAGSALGKQLYFYPQEAGGVAAASSMTGGSLLLTSSWQKATITQTIVENDRTITSIVFYLGADVAIGDTFYLDEVQYEAGDTATAFETPLLDSSFVDPEKTPYYYEVRIKNTVTPDIVGLTRELNRITPAGITFDILQATEV